MSGKARGVHTLQEIATQGGSWRGGVRAAEGLRGAALSELRQVAQEGVLFIGCGSTYYLAQCLAPWTTAVTGWGARAVPSSELAFGAARTLGAAARPTVVALSRSGATSETLLAVEQAHARGCRVVAVTCYPNSELADMADMTLALPEGQEQSFAQTRSFAGMLVAAQLLLARMADAPLAEELRRTPDLATDAVSAAGALAQRWGQADWARVSYLASGWLVGLAGEAMIKMKEMALVTAEAFHAMEFRHGPMALVDREHLVVALLSESMGRYEVGVLSDLAQRGAQVLALGPGQGEEDGDFAASLRIGEGLSEAARPVLYLPFLQLLAYQRAMHAGQDPDRPRNVVMAIRLMGTAMEATPESEEDA